MLSLAVADSSNSSGSAAGLMVRKCPKCPNYHFSSPAVEREAEQEAEARIDAAFEEVLLDPRVHLRVPAPGTAPPAKRHRTSARATATSEGLSFPLQANHGFAYLGNDLVNVFDWTGFAARVGEGINPGPDVKWLDIESLPEGYRFVTEDGIKKVSKNAPNAPINCFFSSQGICLLPRLSTRASAARTSAASATARSANLVARIMCRSTSTQFTTEKRRQWRCLLQR